MVVWLFGLLALLLIAGVEVYGALGLPAVAALHAELQRPMGLPQITFQAIQGELLLSVPLYLLMGYILSDGGAAKHGFRFFDALVGHLPGGTAMATVLAGTFFAGMTGAATAEAAALALITVRPMEELGYGRKFALGLVAATSTLGILIPPSIPMIFFAAVTDVSLGDLFLAGILPGLFIAALLIAVSVAYSWRNGYRRAKVATARERWVAFWRAVPFLLLLVVVVGGLYSGVATPSEVGALAVVYAWFISTFVYRSLTLKGAIRAAEQTAVTASVILFILAAAKLLAFVLTYAQVPQTVAEGVAASGMGQIGFLIAFNVLLFFLGIPLEPGPIIFLTMPVLFPAAVSLGIHPIYLGIVTIVNCQLAQISPPVGASLFVVAGACRVKLEDVFAGVMPFVLVLIGALLVITYWPGLSLALLEGR